MVTLFQKMLQHKKAELERARIRYEEIQRDVAALERTATMDLPDYLFLETSPPTPKLTKKEKHAQRERQVIAIFRKERKPVHLRQFMKELGLAKSSAKDWLNRPIDANPESCPWTRVKGNRSLFILKEHLSSSL